VKSKNTKLKQKAIKSGMNVTEKKLREEVLVQDSLIYPG